MENNQMSNIVILCRIIKTNQPKRLNLDARHLLLASLVFHNQNNLYYTLNQMNNIPERKVSFQEKYIPRDITDVKGIL